MTHPLKGSGEREQAFLKRMEDLASGSSVAEVKTEDLQKLIAIARHWRRLENEAAEFVEVPICMLSPRFTAEPPYVGWKGLGRAIREDYEDMKNLRLLLAEIDRRVPFESHGFGNTFSDSIECYLTHGGSCPTVEEAYSGARQCAKHKDDIDA